LHLSLHNQVKRLVDRRITHTFFSAPLVLGRQRHLIASFRPQQNNLCAKWGEIRLSLAENRIFQGFSRRQVNLGNGDANGILDTENYLVAIQMVALGNVECG
jgi:hypothetical protein